MPIIANTTSGNTFSAIRAQLNSVTKRMNQFAINESSLYANTINANVSLKLSGTDIRATFAQNTYVKFVLANTNSYIAAQATRITLVNTNLTGTNTALRTLISDRLQVANASATYQTKTVERAALANTNLRINLINTNLTGTNTALRTLISDRLQVANATAISVTKASWTALTGTNTALRTLISDRLQVANASTLYATKSNPTTSGLLAHTGRATISTNLYVVGNTVLGSASAVTDRTVINGVTVANGQLSVSGNTVLSGTLVANSSVGTAGYYLRTSGSGIYWSPAAAPNRVISYTDQSSITINADTTDTAIQTYTGIAGTLTINAPTGTLVNGQKVLYRLITTNAQTFSFNAIFRGSTDLTLPTTSSGSSKADYLAFIYNSGASKWDLLAKNFGY